MRSPVAEYDGTVWGSRGTVLQERPQIQRVPEHSRSQAINTL
jgi:hypothetical protein